MPQPAVPITQTIGLLLPSVVVTKGEPQPPLVLVALQPLRIVGGFVAVMRKVESFSLVPAKPQKGPCPCRRVTAGVMGAVPGLSVDWPKRQGIPPKYTTIKKI